MGMTGLQGGYHDMDNMTCATCPETSGLISKQQKQEGFVGAGEELT